MSRYAWVAVSILAIAVLYGCNLAASHVEVRITEVVPGEFDGGHATQCTVNGQVFNNTKYHLEATSFDIGDERFEIGSVEANAYSNRAALKVVTLSAPDGRSCADVARQLRDGASKASALGCTMTSVAEGDCQKMVVISADIKDEDIQKIAQIEAAALAQERERAASVVRPLTNALAAFGDHPSDDQVADTIIRADSQFWAMNHYDWGSAHDTIQISRAQDGSSRTLHAVYTYNNGQSGWVNITLYADMTLIPCVEFWDFAGSCRPLRIPSAVPPPQQTEQAPAPEQETPAPAQEQETPQPDQPAAPPDTNTPAAPSDGTSDPPH